MTVKELINILGQYEENAEVFISDPDAYEYLIDSIEPRFENIAKQQVVINVIEE